MLTLLQPGVIHPDAHSKMCDPSPGSRIAPREYGEQLEILIREIDQRLGSSKDSIQRVYYRFEDSPDGERVRITMRLLGEMKDVEATREVLWLLRGPEGLAEHVVAWMKLVVSLYREGKNYSSVLTS